ncbi:hypothetical protein N324_03433, partial [Chlamydotis macqueenii]
ASAPPARVPAWPRPRTCWRQTAQKAGLPQGEHPTLGCPCCPGSLPPRLPFLRSRSLPLALPSSETVNNSLSSFMSL